jgi:hypothetical protein
MAKLNNNNRGLQENFEGGGGGNFPEILAEEGPISCARSRAVAARRLTRSLLSRSLSEGNVRLSQRTVPPGILSIADEVIE